MPRWFNNQFVSMDNSIRIDTSSVMHDDNWIGVMCYAIFHMDIERYMTGYRSIDHSVRIPLVNLRSDLVIDHSEHMWLFYLSHQEFGERHYDCSWYTPYNGVISVEFTKLIMDMGKFEKGEHQYVKVYVKKYGYW